MNKNTIRIAILLVPSIFNVQADTQYLPVVLVHGIFSDAYYMEPIQQFIYEYLGKGVYVKNVNIGAGESTSFMNMDYQVTLLSTAITQDPQLKNGFNIIGHSQGALVARAYIERCNNPQVSTYISLGGPQQGLFGTPGDFDTRFKFLDYLETIQHYVLYSPLVQKFVGFAGYWHDTIHYETYRSKCWFLPRLNNEVIHSQSARYKKNICSLAHMVLISSDEDDIIDPISSCHFGFYKLGSKTDEETMLESALYINDALGLKTLNESGRLHLRMAHCTHTEYQTDQDNFMNNVLEFLKLNPQRVAAPELLFHS